MKRLLKNLIRAWGYRHTLHFGDALKLFLSNYSSFDMAVRPRGYLAPFFIRAKTSDMSVFKEIFIRKEYPIPGDNGISLIIDAGANVGYASVYFAEQLRHVKIVALEPELSNFQQLLKNTSAYPNIECKHAGLWKSSTRLSIANPAAAKFAIRLEEGAGVNDIPTTTVKDLLEEYKPSGKVLLKLDIEGAEREVISNCQTWINRVDYVYVEIHDCWKQVFDGLVCCDYTARISGEYVIIQIVKLQHH
jgi:FkbM family methyltransferase